MSIVEEVLGFFYQFPENNGFCDRLSNINVALSRAGRNNDIIVYERKNSVSIDGMNCFKDKITMHLELGAKGSFTKYKYFERNTNEEVFHTHYGYCFTKLYWDKWVEKDLIEQSEVNKVCECFIPFLMMSDYSKMPLLISKHNSLMRIMTEYIP